MNWKQEENIHLQRSIKKYKLSVKNDCCDKFKNIWTGKCMLVSCPEKEKKKDEKSPLIDEVFSLLTEADINFCKSNANLRRVGRKFRNCIRHMQFEELCSSNKVIVYNEEFVASIQVGHSSKKIKDKDLQEDLEDQLMNVKNNNYWEMKPVKELWVGEIKTFDNEFAHPNFYAYFLQQIINAFEGYEFIPHDDEEYFITF